MLLSIIPGMSQLYLGLTRKAFSLFIIDVMIASAFIFSDSYVFRFLSGGIYLITFFPASIESYQLAKYGENRIDTDARWYIAVLLLTTGFSALPLLWQSQSFSKGEKLAWTVAVPALAVLFFTVLIKYWDYLEDYLRSLIMKIN